MNFLLDTNVISEPMKPRPNAGVLAWLAEVDSVFLSVVTITELRYGIERLATGRRRDHLDRWLRKDLTSRFGQRILPVDFECRPKRVCGPPDGAAGRIHRCHRRSPRTDSRYPQCL